MPSMGREVESMLLLYAGCNFVEIVMSAPQNLELTLPNMTCGHCQRTVTATVQKLDPQAQMSFDLPAHKVSIATSAPAQRVKDALADEGYPAAA